MSGNKQWKDWLKARSTLWGTNNERKNFALGMELARRCDHPEARWLCATLHGVTSAIEAEVRFRATGWSDGGRSMYWAIRVGAWHLDNYHVSKKIFELRHPILATSWPIGHDDNETFRLAEKCAESGDPCGMYALGDCYRLGRGCLHDRARSHQLYVQAAAHGHVEACYSAAMSSKDLVDKIYWFGKAVHVHDRSCVNLLSIIDNQGINVGTKISFAIGKAIHAVHMRIFGLRSVPNDCMQRAMSHVDFYKSVCARARVAIDLWLRAGLRNKDIRRVIAKLIWKGRDAWI